MTETHEEQLWAATAQVAELTSRVAGLEGRLSDTARKHREDINLIGDAMIAEANERDWCNEYDQFVDGLNAKLNIELPLRVADYTADIRVTVVFTSAPDSAESAAADIARALYNYGDNHGSHEYTIDSSEVTDVEQS
jgi:hypothetical protein